MAWILLAAAAQFINAVVAILDKYIVSDDKILPRPFVYAFYTCLATSLWGLVFLFGLLPGLDQLGVPQLSNIKMPTIQVVGMAFLAAYTFFMALVSMYDSLKSADASDVMPVIGAISALSSFGMGYLFLGASLTPNFLIGVLLLASGTFIVSRARFTLPVAMHTIHSGIFFALHYVAMKGLFSATSFDDGFFWSRIAFVLFALSLLLVPAYYEKIVSQTKTTSKKAGFLVLLTKVMAGVAAFMLLKATDLGEVSVVQALDGLKFVFILLIGIAIGNVTPKTCGENDCRSEGVIRKALYIAIISLGFFVLFV